MIKIIKTEFPYNPDDKCRINLSIRVKLKIQFKQVEIEYKYRSFMWIKQFRNINLYEFVVTKK